MIIKSRLAMNKYVLVISFILAFSWSCSSYQIKAKDYNPGQEDSKEDNVESDESDDPVVEDSKATKKKAKNNGDGEIIKSDKLKHLPKAKWDPSNDVWVPVEKEGHKIIPEKKDKSKDKTAAKKAEPKNEVKKEAKDKAGSKDRKDEDEGDRVIRADKLKRLHQSRWDQSNRVWVKVNKGEKKTLANQKDKSKDKTAAKKAEPKGKTKKESNNKVSSKDRKGKDEGDRVIRADKLKRLHQSRWNQSNRVWVKVNKGEKKILVDQKDKSKDKIVAKKAKPKNEVKKETKDEVSSKNRKDERDKVIRADRLKRLHQSRWNQSNRVWDKVNKGDNIRIKKDKPSKKTKSSSSKKSKDKSDKSVKKNDK